MVKQREESKQQFAKRFNDSLTALGVPNRGRMVATAKMFGVSNSGAKKWIDGESIPDTYRLSDFATKLKVRAEWLLTGIKDKSDIDIGKRIKTLRKEKLWDLPTASKMSSLPMLRYSMIEEGEGRATGEELEAIAAAYEINDWQDLLQIIPTDAQFKEMRQAMNFEDCIDEIQSLTPNKTLINIYENTLASAGNGAFVDSETPTDFMLVETQWLRETVHYVPSKMAIIKVTGDSMEPTLTSGDLILIDLKPIEKTQLNDGIYVIERSGTTHVKRLQSLKDGIRIISDNDLYENETVQDALNVCGRVIWAWKGRRF